MESSLEAKKRLIEAQLSAHAFVQREHAFLEHHRFHRILHEHHLGQNARTARHRRHVTSNVATRVHVHTTGNVIYPSPLQRNLTVRSRSSVRGTHIDHRALGLQPLALDLLHGRSLSRDHIIRLLVTVQHRPYVLEQTGSDVLMAVGQLASHVLVAQEKRNRKANVVAATNNGGLLLFYRKLVRVLVKTPRPTICRIFQ